jgi:hypothetical protein
MRTNLNVILAGIGAAALLASPVAAKTARHLRAAPYAYGQGQTYFAPIAPGTANEGGVYTPSRPVPPYGQNNYDFQDNRRW